MGTVADKLTYLNTTKTNIKNAIINKGVSVSESDTFRSYADKIASIGSDAYKLVTDTTASAAKTLTTAPLPFNSLKVGIEAVQDLHGYDKPWAGGAGKNKLNPDYRVESGNSTINYYLSNTQLSLSANTYCVSVSEACTISVFSYTGGQPTEIKKVYNSTSTSFTLESTSDIGVQFYKSGGFTNITNTKCQIEVGSTATSYAPYSNICPISGWDAVNLNISDADTSNPTTYTIDLDGTRYGGTLDVVNGVLTVDRAYVDLGTLIYTKSLSGLFQTNGIASTVKKSSYSYKPTGYIKSSHFYEIDSASITGPQGSNPSPDGVKAINSAGVLYINYLAVTDVTDFTTAMNGVQLIYELATPITIQLTPTMVRSLLGTTNLWADSGKIEEVGFFEEFNA